jgi:tetratricopeptide (TPR) repeat protein
MQLFYPAIIGLLTLFAQVQAGELHGRVIDRGTLKPNGSATGISDVKISVYDGKRLLASTATNGKGIYRLKKINVARCRVTFRAKGYHPSSVAHDYGPADTSSRDVYLDAAKLEEGGAAGKTKGGYYQGIARGFLALSRNPAFFGEDQEDSLVDMSAFFDARDSSEDYQGIMCELLWAEFLSQDRPLETRYYLAAALAPLLDSLGWGKLIGMSRYLDVQTEAVMKTGKALREAFKNPKKLPNPGDIRKMGMPVSLASQMANEYLADEGISEKAKDRFLVQWKKAWGKDAPSFREDGDEGAFAPNAVMAKLAVSKSGNQEVHYLRGRGLYAAHDFNHAAEALGEANRLAGGHPAARYLEALTYIRLGRDQEALGRFQALREDPNPYWKAEAFRGLALIAEKAGRHTEAAANLWKAERIMPSPENIYRIAEASLKLTDRVEIEKLLEARVARTGDHRAHYWLGRYADENQQTGVSEDHYRKAWAAAPVAEYAEALSRVYLTRDEFGSALSLLEPMRARLTPEGRRSYAECLLQAGRAQEASREYVVAYLANPIPEILSRYTEALIQSNRAREALILVKGFADQTHPMVRFSLAKASIANHNATKAQPILEELVKLEENNADYHYLLGLTYYEQNNYGKAKSEFEEALRCRQDYLEATYYCGLSSVKLGKAEGARNLFNELSQRTSAEWKAKGLMGVGISFIAQQKPEAAESYFQRSLDIHETAEAEALLAMSRRRLGGLEMWVPLAKKAYALDPTNPKAIVIMSEAMIVQNKKGPAMAMIKKALDGNPNSCDLLTALAKCQYVLGSYQTSKTTSASAISLCPQDPGGYFYAGANSEKLQDRKEAESFFKAYRKAGGDVAMLPEEYR